MNTVKILSGSYGEFNEGDIVNDAPPSLVRIAKDEVRNAATGQIVAELINSKPDVDETLLARAKELKVPKADKMDNEQLTAAIQEVEAELELKELKAHAKELKIDGYGKMSAEELKTAIFKAGEETRALDELNQLHSKAADLKIPDFEKMNKDELTAAIKAAENADGGGNSAQ